MTQPTLPIRIIMETLTCDEHHANEVNMFMFHDNSFYWNNATIEQMQTAIRLASDRKTRHDNLSGDLPQ